MANFNDIQSNLNRFGISISRSSIKYISEILSNNESIRLVITGRFPKQILPCLIIATDRRIIAFRKFLFTYELHQMPYSRISNVELKTFQGRLDLYVSSFGTNPIIVWGVNRTQANKLSNLIMDIISPSSSVKQF